MFEGGYTFSASIRSYNEAMHGSSVNRLTVTSFGGGVNQKHKTPWNFWFNVEPTIRTEWREKKSMSFIHVHYL